MSVGGPDSGKGYHYSPEHSPRSAPSTHRGAEPSETEEKGQNRGRNIEFKKGRKRKGLRSRTESGKEESETPDLEFIRSRHGSSRLGRPHRRETSSHSRAGRSRSPIDRHDTRRTQNNKMMEMVAKAYDACFLNFRLRRFNTAQQNICKLENDGVVWESARKFAEKHSFDETAKKKLLVLDNMKASLKLIQKYHTEHMEGEGETQHLLWKRELPRNYDRLSWSLFRASVTFVNHFLLNSEMHLSNDRESRLDRLHAAREHLDWTQRSRVLPYALHSLWLDNYQKLCSELKQDDTEFIKSKKGTRYRQVAQLSKDIEQADDVEKAFDIVKKHYQWIAARGFEKDDAMTLAVASRVLSKKWLHDRTRNTVEEHIWVSNNTLYYGASLLAFGPRCHRLKRGEQPDALVRGLKSLGQMAVPVSAHSRAMGDIIKDIIDERDFMPYLDMLNEALSVNCCVLADPRRSYQWLLTELAQGTFRDINRRLEGVSNELSHIPEHNNVALLIKAHGCLLQSESPSGNYKKRDALFYLDRIKTSPGSSIHLQKTLLMAKGGRKDKALPMAHDALRDPSLNSIRRMSYEQLVVDQGGRINPDMEERVPRLADLKEPGLAPAQLLSSTGTLEESPEPESLKEALLLSSSVSSVSVNKPEEPPAISPLLPPPTATSTESENLLASESDVNGMEVTPGVAIQICEETVMDSSPEPEEPLVRRDMSIQTEPMATESRDSQTDNQWLLEIQQQLADTQREHYEGLLSKQMTILQNLESRLTVMIDERDFSKKETQEALQSCRDLEAKKQQVDGTLERLQTEMQTLNGQLGEAKTERGKLKKYKQNNESKLNSLSENNKALDKQLLALKKDKEKLTSTMRTLQTELQTITTAYEEQMESLDVAGSQIESERREHTQKMQQLTSELESLKIQLKEKEKELQQTDQTVRVSSQQTVQLQKQLEEKTKELSTQKDELDSANLITEKVKKQRADLRASVESLKGQLKTVSGQLTEKQSQIESLQTAQSEQHASLNKQLESMQLEYLATKQSQQAERSELEQLSAENKVFREKLGEQNKTISNMQSQHQTELEEKEASAETRHRVLNHSLQQQVSAEVSRQQAEWIKEEKERVEESVRIVLTEQFTTNYQEEKKCIEEEVRSQLTEQFRDQYQTALNEQHQAQFQQYLQEIQQLQSQHQAQVADLQQQLAAYEQSADIWSSFGGIDSSSNLLASADALESFAPLGQNQGATYVEGEAGGSAPQFNYLQPTAGSLGVTGGYPQNASFSYSQPASHPVLPTYAQPATSVPPMFFPESLEDFSSPFPEND